MVYIFPRTQYTDWSLTEIQIYVAVASFYRYFKAQQLMNLILNNTRDYKKLFSVCKAEILQVTVKTIEVYHLFRLISGDFRLKVPKLAKRGTLVSC